MFRPGTITLLEEHTGVDLYETRSGKVFFDTTPKSINNIRKTDKLDFSKTFMLQRTP